MQKRKKDILKIIMHKLSRLQKKKNSNNYFINNRHYGIQLFVKFREHFAIVKKKRKKEKKHRNRRPEFDQENFPSERLPYS